MNHKSGFYSLNKKFFHFGIGLAGALLVFCALLWGSNQYLIRQQNRLLHVQQAFSTLTEGLSESDSYLYTYAQMNNDTMKEEIKRILDEIALAARDLKEYLGEPIFTDLIYLVDAYCHSGEDVLAEEEGTRELLTLYQNASQDLNIIRSLIGEYRDAVEEDRVRQQAHLHRVQEWIMDGFIVMAVILVGGCLLILRKFSRGITGKLEVLTGRAECICQGQWEIDVPQTGHPKDEVDILSAAFYRMLEVIRNQIEELRRKEALERKLKETEVAAANMKAKWDHARLVTLQSRVNPHFLFNTLNVIGGQAAQEKAEKTMDMIFQTADYLRYSLNKLDKAVTLEEELENAEDYFGIQKGRFGKRLTYSIECEETLRDIKVPSMILQPLCENALIHGIMPKNEGGTVAVRICGDPKRVYITVEDDGLGISPERREEIERRLKARDYDDANGIGLYNVMQRLQEYFGKQAECSIDSVPLAGTRIHLIIPRKGEEEKDEESTVGGR